MGVNETNLVKSFRLHHRNQARRNWGAEFIGRENGEDSVLEETREYNSEHEFSNVGIVVAEEEVLINQT